MFELVLPPKAAEGSHPCPDCGDPRGIGRSHSASAAELGSVGPMRARMQQSGGVAGVYS
jgi:hypothetical protein